MKPSDRSIEPIPFGTPAEVMVLTGIDPDGGCLYDWEATRVLRDFPGYDALEVEQIDTQGQPFALRVHRSDVRIVESSEPTGMTDDHDASTFGTPPGSSLDRAVLAYRNNPTSENRAKVDELLHAHVDAFYRSQAAEFIKKTS